MVVSKKIKVSTTFVSVIVPCYNQGKYLNECLQSVFLQKHSNWECIIVNDGSSDNTELVAKSWEAKDSRFKYLFKNNGGLSSARNAGIMIAKGELILPLDADDKISESYMTLALNAFEQDKNLKVVYCKAEKFGEDFGFWKLTDYSISGLAYENMIFCSSFFKKKDWVRVGGYDESMVIGLEDWDFWIAVLKDGGNVKRLDEIGFYYRVKNESMIKNLNSEKRKILLNYLSIKHADFFVKHVGSFFALVSEKEHLIEKFEIKLKSEKFVIDLFCSTFLGFSIFGLFKKKK